MRLFIVRHGEAESLATRDKLRNLTDNGRLEVAKTGRWLSQQSPNFASVLVSPYVRAQQTWGIIQEQGLSFAKAHTIDEITPEGDPATAASIINAYAHASDDILVVSHLPLVSYLVEEFTRQMGPIFATASVARIDCNEDGLGELIQLTLPSQMA